MASRAPAAAALLLVLSAPGCGKESAKPPDPSASPPTVAATTLATFQLQDEEVPGLTPGPTGPMTDTGDPFDLPAGGDERLKQSGYLSTTYQPAEGDASAGVSSVLLFETEAGARDWMAYETSDEVLQHQVAGAEIERFGVHGVPGARGWTGPDQHGNPIGHVYWTQGRCMMLVGLETDGPRVERLSAGARAIFERTGGTCPD